jgi:methionyl aminopeptidase
VRLSRRSRFEIKSEDQIRLMRAAGLVVADALAKMAAAAGPGVSTADLDGIAQEVLREAGAASSFLGYDLGNGPYPGVICASINDRVVHGIPTDTDVLRDGDVISLDFGAIVEGWHADAAVTVGVGEVAREVAALDDAGRAALWAGLAAVQAGTRLGDVSASIEESVRASGDYGIVEGFGGHGIGSAMHMNPHILNYGRRGTGPELVPGMAVAIEPMLTLGHQDVRQLEDGWTIVTEDGSVAVHWEHTVVVLEDGTWVLTAFDGGRAELGKRGVTLSAMAD